MSVDQANEQKALADLQQRAGWAQSVLSDPRFNAVYRELSDELLNRISATSPSEATIREELYYELRGLQMMVAKFGYWYQKHKIHAESLGLQPPEGTKS